MRTDITLHGSKADQFERIENYLEDRRGDELSRADIVGIIMAEFEQDLQADRRRAIKKLDKR